MTRIVIAIALLALMQLACAASANLNAGQTPAPQPTPIPPTPQVIVIDRPAPTPAQHDDSALIVFVIVMLAGTLLASGAAIGYIARGKPQEQPASSVPQSLTLTTNNYYSAQPPTLSPAQLTEAEQFAILRKMGHSPESARNMIVSGVARQICAPK